MNEFELDHKEGTGLVNSALAVNNSADAHRLTAEVALLSLGTNKERAGAIDRLSQSNNEIERKIGQAAQQMDDRAKKLGDKQAKAESIAENAEIAIAALSLIEQRFHGDNGVRAGAAIAIAGVKIFAASKLASLGVKATNPVLIGLELVNTLMGIFMGGGPTLEQEQIKEILENTRRIEAQLQGMRIEMRLGFDDLRTRLNEQMQQIHYQSRKQEDLLNRISDNVIQGNQDSAQQAHENANGHARSARAVREAGIGQMNLVRRNALSQFSQARLSSNHPQVMTNLSDLCVSGCKDYVACGPLLEQPRDPLGNHNMYVREMCASLAFEQTPYKIVHTLISALKAQRYDVGFIGHNPMTGRFDIANPNEWMKTFSIMVNQFPPFGDPSSPVKVDAVDMRLLHESYDAGAKTYQKLNQLIATDSKGHMSLQLPLHLLSGHRELVKTSGNEIIQQHKTAFTTEVNDFSATKGYDPAKPIDQLDPNMDKKNQHLAAIAKAVQGGLKPCNDDTLKNEKNEPQAVTLPIDKALQQVAELFDKEALILSDLTGDQLSLCYELPTWEGEEWDLWFKPWIVPKLDGLKLIHPVIDIYKRPVVVIRGYRLRSDLAGIKTPLFRKRVELPRVLWRANAYARFDEEKQGKQNAVDLISANQEKLKPGDFQRLQKALQYNGLIWRNRSRGGINEQVEREWWKFKSEDPELAQPDAYNPETDEKWKLGPVLSALWTGIEWPIKDGKPTAPKLDSESFFPGERALISNAHEVDPQEAAKQRELMRLEASRILRTEYAKYLRTTLKSIEKHHGPLGQALDAVEAERLKTHQLFHLALGDVVEYDPVLRRLLDEIPGRPELGGAIARAFSEALKNDKLTPDQIAKQILAEADQSYQRLIDYLTFSEKDWGKLKGHREFENALNRGQKVLNLPKLEVADNAPETAAFNRIFKHALKSNTLNNDQTKSLSVTSLNKLYQLAKKHSTHHPTSTFLQSLKFTRKLLTLKELLARTEKALGHIPDKLDEQLSNLLFLKGLSEKDFRAAATAASKISDPQMLGPQGKNAEDVGKILEELAKEPSKSNVTKESFADRLNGSSQLLDWLTNGDGKPHTRFQTEHIGYPFDLSVEDRIKLLKVVLDDNQNSEHSTIEKNYKGLREYYELKLRGHLGLKRAEAPAKLLSVVFGPKEQGATILDRLKLAMTERRTRKTRNGTEFKEAFEEDLIAAGITDPKKFGKAWQDPTGMIWSDIARHKTGRPMFLPDTHAQAYCKSMGAELPSGWREEDNGKHGYPNSDSDFVRLRKYMGYSSQTRQGYQPEILTTGGSSFWSSTRAPYSTFDQNPYYSFCGGTIGQTLYSGKPGRHVRCVVRAASQPDPKTLKQNYPSDWDPEN